MRPRIKDPRFYLYFGSFWLLFAAGVAADVIALRDGGPPRALTVFAGAAIAAILFLSYARKRGEVVEKEEAWERL
jgi:hypothetical protein